MDNICSLTPCTVSERTGTSVHQNWILLPKLLVCAQAQLPTKHWSRALGRRKKCLPKGWDSKAEILCPKLSLLPRIGCSTDRDLRMASELWAVAPHGNSKTKHCCASTTSMSKCSLGAQPTLALLSHSCVQGRSFLLFHCYLGFGVDIGICYSFFFLLPEATCTCKGGSSQSVSLTTIRLPWGGSEELLCDVSLLMCLLWYLPVFWS